MSQYNSQKGSGNSRSRAKGSSSGSRSSSRSGSSSVRSSSSRSNSHKSNYSYSSRSSGGRRSSKRRRNQGGGFMKLAIGGVLLIIAIAIIVSLLKGTVGSAESDTASTTAPQETELQKEVHVDGIDITGMSRDAAKAAILKNYPWSMTVVWNDKTYEVADLMAGKVDLLLEDIYTGEPEESYTLDTSGLEEAVRSEAANVAAQWNKNAKNGSISSYDAAADKFIFSGAETGLAVDEDKLIADIQAALSAKDFDADIQASVVTIQPEFDEDAARQRYEKLSTFTTKTTANSNRNTNVKLAAQAVNGTVVQPGQEFSFNETVGQRTEAKGYKGAAAYNNGEVVQEIGGGVCQVSSTLYNAVVKAGLKTTVRRSHTYEPSYVTPGTDAAISWGGPDYKFVNNSNAGIGIRAHYADQSLTVSIYGIPILEDGVTYSLQSKKLKDTDPPAPTYEEDPTLEPGIEKVKDEGSIGSQWETRLIIKKDGEIVSQDVDHKVTYKGHAPVILRNTSGTVAESLPEEGMIDPLESSVAPEGAGDGFHENGPGGDTAADSPASEPETSAQERETTEAAKPTTAETTAAVSTTAPSSSAAPTTAPTQPRTEETSAAAKPTSASQAETTASAPTSSAPAAAVKPSAAESSNSQTPGSAPTAASGGVQMIAPNPGA